MRYIRMLELLGCLSRIPEPEPRKDGKMRTLKVSFVKDVDAQARHNFLYVWSKTKESSFQDDPDDDDAGLAGEDPAVLDNAPHLALSNTESGKDCPPMPQYNLEELSYNFIHDMVNRAGPKGATFTVRSARQIRQVSTDFASRKCSTSRSAHFIESRWSIQLAA